MCGFLVMVEMLRGKPLRHSGTVFHAAPAIAVTEHFHSDLCRRDAGQSGGGLESFTRCCPDYGNICNTNRGAEHQHSRHNSRDNEATLSAPDTAALMFLSQLLDYVSRAVPTGNHSPGLYITAPF